MNTKRLVLMLLVMLGCVTMWAQGGIVGDMKWEYDGGTRTLTFSSVDPNSNPVAMPNYERGDSRPWNKEVYEVVSVRFINISHIGQMALYGAENLSSVEIPNTVTNIGQRAFQYCTSLTQLTLPNSITGIGYSAFGWCNNLTSINIPDGVTELWGTFTSCPSLVSITIPASITVLDNYLFNGCTALSSIVVEAETPPIVRYKCFEGVDKTIPVYVPKGKANVYKETKDWNEFTNIIEISSQGLRQYVENTYGDNWNEALTTYVNERGTAIDEATDVATALQILKEGVQATDEGIAAHQHDYHYIAVSSDQHRSICQADGYCAEYVNEPLPHVYNNEATPGTEEYYICSVCGYLDPVRQHVHNYDAWSADGTHHWHECTSEVGTCTAKTIGVTEHTYGSSNNNDALNYTCDVCGYVNETLKAPYDARDYMSMTAKGGDVVVETKKYDKDYIPSYVIQYSLDRVNWTDYAMANDGEIVTIPEGETYYFRSGMPDVLTSVMDEFWNFTMTGTGTIEAGGNVMSLLDRSCQSLTVGDNAFRNLFDGCTPLTVAPKVPATTLGEWCYTEMFNGCTQLQKAPHLPATTLKFYCYAGMFDGCSSLDYVEADFTEAQRGKNDRYNLPFSCATEDWLNGTAANGLLVMKREMIEKELNFNDAVSITSGWQRALKVKANEDPDHKGNFYTTFYDGKYSFDVIGEAKAYSGSIDGDELRLTPTPGNKIPQDDGVLLHGPSADMVLAIHSSGAERIDCNVLTGSDNNTTAPANCYILSYGQNRLGFYKYAAGKTLSAHKAYLVYEKPAGANSLRMVFADEEVDGIENIKDNDSLRYDNDNIYSLSGVRLDKLQKGINIVGGKKIVVK